MFALKNGLSPRKWQRYALEAWSFQMKGIIKVVTGGGKTIFSLFCMKNFFTNNPDGICVIVVPTIALMDQWFVEIIENTNVTEDSIAMYGGGKKPSGGEIIHLMVVNTARKKVSEIASDIPIMLIVDECHRAATVENSKSLELETVATLGLSATPERQYDEGFEEILVPTLGPIVYEYGYVLASKDGVIANFELVNVKLEFDLDESEKYAFLTKQIAKCTSESENEEKLVKLLRRRSEVVSNALIRIPWAVKLALLNQGSKIIIFHERISALESIEKLLSNKGISVTTYHSKLSGPLRRRNLQMFRKGMVDVLVTCRALDEGMNVPEAEIGIIASSTASTRQRVQRLGRVLRPAPGKDFAKIYTLFITDIEEQRLIEEILTLSEVSSSEWLVGGFSDE
jgi:superfamily II DNA or RNA helicase